MPGGWGRHLSCGGGQLQGVGLASGAPGVRNVLHRRQINYPARLGVLLRHSQGRATLRRAPIASAVSASQELGLSRKGESAVAGAHAEQHLRNSAPVSHKQY